MNVLVRSKRAKKGGGRHFRASAPHPPRAEAQPRTAAPGRSHRDHLPLQDNALYSCPCGFVFEAAVSTTVDCPHCGTGQAW